MRPYEMMIILAPDIPEDELDPSIDTIESYITREDGTVVVINRESPWGRRRLAYPIRHDGRDVRDGFYTLWYFDAEPTAIVEIEREIRLNDRIIRHMIIALDEQVTLIPIEPEAAPVDTTEEGASVATDAADETTPEAAASEATTSEDAGTEESAPETASIDDTAAAEETAPEAVTSDEPAAPAEEAVAAPAEEAAPDEAPAEASENKTSEE